MNTDYTHELQNTRNTQTPNCQYALPVHPLTKTVKSSLKDSKYNSEAIHQGNWQCFSELGFSLDIPSQTDVNNSTYSTTKKVSSRAFPNPLLPSVAVDLEDMELEETVEFGWIANPLDKSLDSVPADDNSLSSVDLGDESADGSESLDNLKELITTFLSFPEEIFDLPEGLQVESLKESQDESLKESEDESLQESSQNSLETVVADEDSLLCSETIDWEEFESTKPKTKPQTTSSPSDLKCPVKTRLIWKEAYNSVLLEAAQKHEGEWAKIQQRFYKKTKKTVRVPTLKNHYRLLLRLPTLEKTETKFVNWDKEKDDFLLKLIKKHGENWGKVQRHFNRKFKNSEANVDQLKRKFARMKSKARE